MLQTKRSNRRQNKHMTMIRIDDTCYISNKKFWWICFLETFHKYDGHVYPKPSGWSIQRLWRDASISVTDDRKAFFREFFPKWSGFYVDDFDCNIQPVEALQKLACLTDNISYFWTSTSGNPQCHTNDPNKLKLGEVGGRKVKRSMRANRLMLSIAFSAKWFKDVHFKFEIIIRDLSPAKRLLYKVLQKLSIPFKIVPW